MRARRVGVAGAVVAAVSPVSWVIPDPSRNRGSTELCKGSSSGALQPHGLLTEWPKGGKRGCNGGRCPGTVCCIGLLLRTPRSFAKPFRRRDCLHRPSHCPFAPADRPVRNRSGEAGQPKPRPIALPVPPEVTPHTQASEGFRRGEGTMEAGADSYGFRPRTAARARSRLVRVQGEPCESSPPP